MNKQFFQRFYFTIDFALILTIFDILILILVVGIFTTIHV